MVGGEGALGGNWAAGRSSWSESVLRYGIIERAAV